MKPKKKILAVLNSLPGEPFILNHLKTIYQGIENINLVIAFGSTASSGLIEIPINGVKAFAIPNFDRLSRIRKAFYFIKYPFTKRAEVKSIVLRRFFERQKADTVHFHFATTAIKWHKYLPEGMPFTFSIRGSDINVAPVLRTNYLQEINRISKLALQIHVVNEELADRFNSLISGFDSKIKCIPTVIQSDFYDVQNIPKKGYFLAIGRLHWIKGHRDLLLACKKLRKKNIDFKLEIIGEGKERQVLEFMIRDLGLENHVKLVGHLNSNEIKKRLSKCSFLVQSSLDEGFPNSIAEAMAASVPIVSTRCGGIEKVLNTQNALLSEIGEPDKLADNLEIALNDNFNRQEWVDQNKKLAKHLFSAESHCSKFAQFWNLNG